MIEIFFGRDVTGFIRKVVAQGHSGFAPSGEDIVCAGVSALTQAAAITLAEMEIGESNVDEETANLSIELPKNLSIQEMHDAQIILRTIRCGLAAIAEEYPQYVKIKEVNL